MTLLNSGDLAKALNVSKGRVSQYVSEGKLAGCYSGDGRARRFDLAKAAAALGRQLHPGQMMGNGAQTRAAIRTVVTTTEPRPGEGQLGRMVGVDVGLDGDDDDEAIIPAKPLREGGALGNRDTDRYELARIQKVEEEARRLRRQNAEAEGIYVLASEVERQVARMLSQEIAEVESVLRDGSRRVADTLGVDFKKVRQLMLEQWRSHRAKRTEVLQGQADAAEMSPDEVTGNI